MAASSGSRAFINPDLPQEIIVEILLRVPPKSLLKCKCVSKSWLQLISSLHFVNTHLELSANDKEFRLHRVLFQARNSNFMVCLLSSLFYKEPNCTQVFNLGMTPPGWIVDSANGLICLSVDMYTGVIWNPVIRKSKVLPKLKPNMINMNFSYSWHCKWGFGYDKLHDDYKVVVIQSVIRNGVVYDNVVYMYSLRTDSWRPLPEFQGKFPIKITSKYVNGKLYWATSTSSAGTNGYNACNIVSLDLEDETWGKLELPDYGEDRSLTVLGALGSDLSMLCTCRRQGSTCDVWIMKDCGVGISWSKTLTIRYPNDLWEMHKLGKDMTYCFAHPSFFNLSNKGEFFVFLPGIAIIYNPKDDSTRQLEINGYAEWRGVETYVESLVDPLLIVARG